MGNTSFEKVLTKAKEEEIEQFLCEEADASDEESTTILSSNKLNYVLSVNNSKLARKPYYKQL